MSSVQSGRLTFDGGNVWEGPIQNGRQTGRGKLTYQIHGSIQEEFNVRYINRNQDGYIACKTLNSPNQRVVKEVMENGKLVFIKSVLENKNFYLTYEVEGSKPMGRCVLEHFSAKACYVSEWTKDGLKNPVVYQRINEVDRSQMSEIRKMIKKECDPKDSDDSDSTFVIDQINLERDTSMRDRGANHITRFGTELE